MSVVQHHVFNRGQVSLPAETCRRWNIIEGGPVKIADRGIALLIASTAASGLRRLLSDAI